MSKHDPNDWEYSVPPLSEEQKRKLERRADEDDAFPDDVIPWEEVKAITLARLRSLRSRSSDNERS